MNSKEWLSVMQQAEDFDHNLTPLIIKYGELLLSESATPPPASVGTGDMTAREFFTDPKSPLTLDFLNETEREFLLDMIELYAKRKSSSGLPTHKGNK